MPYSLLLLSRPAPGVAVVTLNRTDAANALNSKLAEELAACFNTLDPAIRAVVLTGAGRHFCAGADLKERKGMSEAQWEAQHKLLRAARDAVLECPVPVIAAVNGGAYGGGLELALSCDIIYAAAGAKFALTEATLGIMPGMGGTQLLPRAVGARHAAELLFTGKAFSAQDAQKWGMATRACSGHVLLDEALMAATAIAANAPLAVKAIKQAMRDGLSLPLPQAMEVERKAYKALIPTKDRQEGINAFNEKRKPVFKGA